MAKMDSNVVEEIRRFAVLGSGLVELSRNQAEKMVKDLVKAGDIRRKESSGLLKELIERSKENRKELARFVRSEIQNQLKSLGVASSREVERLERRIARIEDRSKSTPKKTAAKKTTAKETTAKKSPAKKSTAKKTTAPSTEKPGGAT